MTLRNNIIANYLGQGCTAVMGVAFVPIYIRYLGLEGYGLIGIFLLLQAWLSVLDFGMTPMLNREMARLRSGAHTSQSIHDLLYSVECLYFIQTVLIVFGIWLVAPWLAVHWVSANSLPIDTIVSALTLMGVICALRWLSGLYRGALMGLQSQVWLNVAAAVLAILRFGGAAVVVALISPKISSFFCWQLLVSVIECHVFMRKVKAELPSASGSRAFSLSAIQNVWGFAKGVIATSLLVLVLTQIDKIILSKSLTLEEFGGYTLASTIANALSIFFSPISAAVYPQFTELVTQNRKVELAEVYHQSAQLLTTLATPVALMLVFWGRPILQIWSGDTALANLVSPILALLALGTLINGYMNVPYMLQLASGWSSFAAWTNVVAVIVIVPATLILVPIYGAVAAAALWLSLNLGYFLIGMHFMHKKLIPDQKWHWYIRDIFFPFACAVAVVSGSLKLMPRDASLGWNLLVMVLVAVCAYLALAIINRRAVKSFFIGAAAGSKSVI